MTYKICMVRTIVNPIERRQRLLRLAGILGNQKASADEALTGETSTLAVSSLAEKKPDHKGLYHDPEE